ncbi:S-layer homology domain-containing protein [Oscillibacter hominis]|uniref:S-layer homology domain-containing protein n=1 Tax=Oscillibacter hominis TaxID=2763056 RepID=A0A7G9B462_9FIRM|nr:S-layer homology domain-containing protein [Oscillibacter hominis]QNL44343.1 S-layer homology domain-containing protein [Oscillibacter hominis]
MKKFLSLALALVMALSLFTVASAAEYSDLTDKDEITYSEAVAVLNKLGIISGYEDGSFKPTTALNRAQAAKIMCGLLLTQATADKLTVSAAPFKDVSADYWAAAYISYCKNAGILDGYSDGTFRPTATLTGYQFVKMLLTALGYNSQTEKFVGSGWTLNVARVSNGIGLTNGNSEFGGNSEVTREEACLYALNMLKATEVTYDGTTVSVNTGDAQVTVGSQKAYKVENLGDSDGNIKKDKYMQFAEEHFGALKLTSTAASDDFGRPANSWSYRNVTFGTYGKQPTFSYTAAASGSTDSAKVKNMGLSDYTVNDALTGDGDNAGLQMKVTVNGKTTTDTYASNTAALTAIAKLTGNGTKVEIYTDEDTADLITAVVVVKTEIAKIDRISTSAKTVTLVSKATDPTSLVKVDEDNAYYKSLSGMKAGDYVLVVPVLNDDGKYEVYSAVAATSDKGALSRVAYNSSSVVNGVTVNGTAYKLSATAAPIKTDEEDIKGAFGGLNSSSINANKDCVVYLDSYGYAIYIDDVSASTNLILVADVYQTLVDGKMVNMVQGYDMSGNAISLNAGTTDQGAKAQTVMIYTTDGAPNIAEYKLTTEGIKDTSKDTYVIDSTAAIASSDVRFGGVLYASDVQFIYVTEKTDGTIEKVTVKDGVQKVSSDKTQKIAVVDGSGSTDKVTTVIVLAEDVDAVGASVAYVSAITGSTKLDGKTATIYTLYIDGEKVEGVISTNGVSKNTFVTYTDKGDNVYTLNTYEADESVNKSTAVAVSTTLNKSDITDNRIIAFSTLTDMNAANVEVIDLTTGNNFGSLADLSDEDNGFNSYQVSIVYNGNEDSNAFKTVSYIFVEKAND